MIQYKQQAIRLSTLRTLLKKREIDGFLIPRADEHQGENVAEHTERLAWFTGFGGSAGLAIALLEHAALFVDGRYTLQAREETDPGLYEHHHISEHPPTTWLAQNVSPGKRIGFDPWLHTQDNIESFRRALAPLNISLVPITPNPIDVIWEDRAPTPKAPAFPYPLMYAGLSVTEKIGDVVEQLVAAGENAALISAPDSLCWLLNIRGHDVPHTPQVQGYALVHTDHSVDVFLETSRRTPALHTHLEQIEPPTIVRVHDREDLLDNLASQPKGTVVRVDRLTASVAVMDAVTHGGAQARRANDPCALPKACKNDVELRGARAAHHRDACALIRFLSWLDARLAQKDPPSELEAAAYLLERRSELEHFLDLSFETISAAGPHAAICHYRVSPDSDLSVASGALYLVDSGGQYMDGTTDVTRTVASGPLSPEHIRHYTLVLKGHIALAQCRFPQGTTGSQLDVLARQYLWAEGLDYDHGTGHGVGQCLSVHEGPQRLSKTPSAVALQPGMIVSNEPGYYKAGDYGIRIEMLQVVIEISPVCGESGPPFLGFETLTLAPLDARLIDTALLTENERAWVDAYHTRIRHEISPHIPEGDRLWLEKTTRPLVVPRVDSPD